MIVFLQLDRERDHAVLRQRSNIADRPVQFFTADLDNRLTAGSNTVSVGIGNLTFDLEMRQVGNDCHLRSLAYLRADLVVHIGQDRLTRRTDLGIFQRTPSFGKAFTEDIQFQLFYFQIRFGQCLFVLIFLLVFLQFEDTHIIIKFHLADFIGRTGSQAV